MFKLYSLCNKKYCYNTGCIPLSTVIMSKVKLSILFSYKKGKNIPVSICALLKYPINLRESWQDEPTYLEFVVLWVNIHTPETCFLLLTLPMLSINTVELLVWVLIF